MADTILSFEVFPPKKEDEFEEVYSVLDKLGMLNPAFISVTYGAGGSRSKKTVEIASYIQNKLNITALAHMTCVGNKKEDIDQVIDQLSSNNIKHVLALRGDRPAYMTDAQFNARDFSYASELIAYLKAKDSTLHIAGACYPEKHFEAESLFTDLNHLQEKVDCGCEMLISQLFMKNDFFYRFREACLDRGITVPIHAGIMPITSVKQLDSSISLSGSSIPKAFSDLIARYGAEPDEMRKAGIDYAIQQIIDLQKHGVDGIHLYSMNRPKTTAEIVNALSR
ncbi:MAG: methylenetetrahydrofolate reductase [NAD(P)H] [Acetatifactor sp.]|nr:methylenetetrahydrofolate reductase [NAD(P)H] [Acetatifactor sp.]